MENKTNLERRRFFKIGALAVASLLAAPALKLGSLSGVAFGADALPDLSEDDPMAKNLGYHKNAKKVDPKKWPKRAGAEGKTQFCNNCMFFTGTDKGKGKCQIFQGKLVMANGWCNSWTKKA